MTKLKKIFIVICSLCATISAAYAYQNQPYQSNAGNRQVTLISLAAILGEIHHLRQLCAPYDRPNLWRERMKELVTVENPVPKTKEQMINAFNKSFRTATIDHPECTNLAINQSRQSAIKGQQYTNALAAPFKTYDIHDTKGYVDENGVTVF